MTFKDKIDSLFGDIVAKALEETNKNDKSDDGDGLDAVQPDAVKKKFKDRKDKDIDNDGDVDDSDEYLHKRRKAVSKAIANEEVEVLDESKSLLKDYQAMKAQGKKDSNIMDALMSMPKYKKMSRDQMSKVIGDAKRKGIFKEEIELDEESSTIAKVKEIASKKQAMKVDGVMVDMFTASAIAQIYDKVNDANKKKMDGLKITKLADLAMKMMKREEVELDEGAMEDGAKAARDGKKYSENPHKKGSKDHLDWSKGHNSARAAKLNMGEEKVECPQCEGEGCDHCDGKGYHEKVEEAKNYEYKDGKVHISKANFRKVHKDYKNATKGKERMMVLDPKTQASVSAPVVFTESSFKEKFKRSLSRRFAESKIEESDVAERHNELKSMPPVELMKLYQKHYDETDIDKVKNMDKDELISKIIKAENGED